MAEPRTDAGSVVRSDTTRIAVVVVAAVAQVVAGPLGGALPGATDVATVSDRYDTVVTPAGYAFAIWGVLFLGSLAWAVFQALPGQRERDVHRRTGWWLAAAFAGNALWQLTFVRDGVWLLVANVIIFVVVVTTGVAVKRLQWPEPEGLARLLPGAVAALLLGWVTFAAVANVAISGVYLGAPATGARTEAAGVIALITAAAIVLDVTMRLITGSALFAAAALWGLIAVGQAAPPLPVQLAAWVACALVVIGVLAQLWRTRRFVRVLLS